MLSKSVTETGPKRMKPAKKAARVGHKLKVRTHDGYGNGGTRAARPIMHLQACSNGGCRSSRPPCPVWPERLATLASKLKSLSINWKNALPAAWEELHSLRAEAEKITVISERLIKTMHGVEVEETIGMLDWVMDMLRDWRRGLGQTDMDPESLMRADKLMDTTAQCLVSLKASHRLTAAMAKDLCLNSLNVSRYLEDALGCLEYCDITCRMFEQVALDVEGLAAGLKEERGGAVHKDPETEMRSACAIQADALCRAKEEFDSVTVSVAVNLRLAAQNASALFEAARPQDNDTEVRTSADWMDEWLSGIAEDLAQFSEHARQAGQSSKGLGLLESGSSDYYGILPELVDILNGMVKSMHGVNKKIADNTSSITEAAGGLSLGIGSIIERFRIREDIPAASEEYSRGIGRLAGEFRAITTAG